MTDVDKEEWIDVFCVVFGFVCLSIPMLVAFLWDVISSYRGET